MSWCAALPSVFWTFIQNRTAFGRHVYAVGGNAEAGLEVLAAITPAQVAEAQDLELIDRHVDGVAARQAIRGKTAIFGDDSDAAQFLASSCHAQGAQGPCPPHG